MLPKAVTDELEKLVTAMEQKMNKRSAAQTELRDLNEKIRQLELENKWPNGYSKPAIAADPLLLDTQIGASLIGRFASTDESNPLFNVRPATTMGQLKFMVHLAAIRQIMYLDAEMMGAKIAQLGRERLLEVTMKEMKSCVAARFKAYEDEGFEVPAAWNDPQQYEDKLTDFLDSRYKEYLAAKADVLIDEKKKDAKMKEKEAEAREKGKEAGREVSLMAAVRSEATQVIEEVLTKGKKNKTLKDENDVSKTRKEAVKLLDAPPGLELNAATLAVARIQGNEVMDENDVQQLCQKVDAMPKVKGKGKGKGSGKRTTKG